jgi:hypothetical protein
MIDQSEIEISSQIVIIRLLQGSCRPPKDVHFFKLGLPSLPMGPLDGTTTSHPRLSMQSNLFLATRDALTY